MDGLPVTVRLLDPPLHEFLPDIVALEVAAAAGTLDAAGRRAAGRGPAHRTSTTRCSVCAGSGWGSCARRSTACRSGPSSRRRRPGSPRGGDPRPRVIVPLVSTVAELVADPPDDRRRGGGGRAGRTGARRRRDGRDPPGGTAGRPPRRGGRLPVLRHQRPHPDDLRLQPGRRRAPARGLPRRRAARRRPVRDRSTRTGSGSSWPWPSSRRARRPDRACRSVSAASTGPIRRRSGSCSAPGSTTSAARRGGCPWPGSRRPRRCWPRPEGRHGTGRRSPPDGAAASMAPRWAKPARREVYRPEGQVGRVPSRGWGSSTRTWSGFGRRPTSSR